MLLCLEVAVFQGVTHLARGWWEGQNVSLIPSLGWCQGVGHQRVEKQPEQV